MTAGRVEFYPDVLEEFFEELDFLWSQREAVVFASDWTLRDLEDLEERAEAHLDGLRLSGDDGIDLARPSLRGEETEPATAAAFVLMEGRRPDLDAAVVRALVEAGAPAKEGIGIALRHTDIHTIAEELRRLAGGSIPLTQSIAVDVLAFHRLGPPPPVMFELFASPDPVLRARAYAAAGRFGGPWSPDDLQAALDQPDPGVRWAAIHASARLTMPGLQETLRRAAARADGGVPEAIEFLGALGDPKDIQMIKGFLRHPSARAAAIRGLGASGHVSAVPLLLDVMHDPAVAIEAGRAFVRVTGARGIEGAGPAPLPPDLQDDDREFHSPETPPDPDKATMWWVKEKGRFREEARWQSGFATSPLGFRAASNLPLLVRRDVFFSERARGAENAGPVELEARARLQVG